MSLVLPENVQSLPLFITNPPVIATHTHTFFIPPNQPKLGTVCAIWDRVKFYFRFVPIFMHFSRPPFGNEGPNGERVAEGVPRVASLVVPLKHV